MSFHIATVDNTLNPSHVTNIRPLRLGGADGLIAKHVKSLGSASESTWNLTEPTLLKSSGGQSGCDAVFFRPGGEADGLIEIYRVEAVQGICSGDRTDLVFSFAPLLMREVGAGAWDIEEMAKRVLCESLSLSGGPSGGRWLWTDSPMSLGATVVGGCSGGCSSGASESPAKECCGNCH